jgi:hypothetical protein
VITHDLKSCVQITDDGNVGDVIDELVAAVATARASGAQADADHERVKELFVRARVERPDLGPGDLEELTEKYMDRSTISRVTVPKMGGPPPRKPTRRRSRS